MDLCAIVMRGRKVDEAHVSHDATIVESGRVTLVGDRAEGYASIVPGPLRV